MKKGSAIPETASSHSAGCNFGGLWRTFLVAATACFLGHASAVSASVIIDVGGPRDGGESFGPALVASGAAIGFTLDSDISNFALDVDVECFGCTGTFYLTQGPLGPTASVLDLRAVTPFAVGFPTLVFSGLDLTAGEYFAIAVVETGGFGLWAASTAPIITENGGSDGGDFLLTGLNISLPTRSDFTLLPGTAFRYSVTGDAPDAVTVPAPAAALLLAGGLAAIALRRRRPIGKSGR